MHTWLKRWRNKFGMKYKIRNYFQCKQHECLHFKIEGTYTQSLKLPNIIHV
jgi:hypothetical protein